MNTSGISRGPQGGGYDRSSLDHDTLLIRKVEWGRILPKGSEVHPFPNGPPPGNHRRGTLVLDREDSRTAGLDAARGNLEEMLLWKQNVIR